MNDETKSFLVELFDVRFAEQEKRLDAKFDAKFAEQREYIENRLEDQTFQVTQIANEILYAVNRRFKRERKKTDEKIESKIAAL
ncbi:MAG: hypothetical protein J5881_02070 [Clostridia bacterium]|nr:hypothetical protein [Clostridia bacterium]